AVATLRVADELAGDRGRPSQTSVGICNTSLKLAPLAVGHTGAGAFVVTDKALRIRTARAGRARRRLGPVQTTVGIGSALPDGAVHAADTAECALVIALCTCGFGRASACLTLDWITPI